MEIYADKNGMRFNHLATIKVDGVIYYGNILDFPKVVERLGLTKHTLGDTPPEGYVESEYFRTEPQRAPFEVVYTRKDQAVIDAEKVALATAQRRAAYEQEADPLFFQEQRKEVPEGTWEAKIKEIQARYPK